MDREATLRHFAKTVVNLSSGSLLARLPIPRYRKIGCAELFTLGDPALGKRSAPLCIAFRRPESPPHHYEAVNHCGGSDEEDNAVDVNVLGKS
ncbi:hypothetical protein RB195_016769 [Necator americanus]|uniref:Uncharacterized protein n=1 Tax=Necator americanus TaxID=51031 RepID=A0ABR1C227_NECAM